MTWFVLGLYSGWIKGHPPFAGGMMDQPAWLDQALRIVAGAAGDVERAHLKKQQAKGKSKK